MSDNTNKHRKEFGKLIFQLSSIPLVVCIPTLIAFILMKVPKEDLKAITTFSVVSAILFLIGFLFYMWLSQNKANTKGVKK